VAHVVFSPNGRQLLGTGDGWVYQFRPDGYSATGVQDGVLGILWDVATSERVTGLAWPKKERGYPRTAIFSADGRRILTTGNLGRATSQLGVYPALWDATNGKWLRSFKPAVPSPGVGDAAAAVFSPDGQRVVVSYDSSGVPAFPLRLWNVETGKELAAWRGPAGGAHAVAFSPDGRYVVGACGDKAARLWEAASACEFEARNGCWPRLNCAAVSADGTRAITSSYPDVDDGWTVASVWDTASGRWLCRLKGHTRRISLVCLSANGSKAFTASLDGTGRLWDAVRGEELVRLKGEKADPINKEEVGLPPEVLRDLQEVMEADPTNKERPFAVPLGLPKSVQFSPDGRYLVTVDSGSSSCGRVWETATGRELPRLWRREGTPRITAFAFSADGRRVFTKSAEHAQSFSSTGCIWDLATGREIVVIPGTVQWRESGNTRGGTWEGFEAPCFSPDGEYLLFISLGRVRIWSATTGTEERPLEHPNRNIRSAHFSSDSKRVVTSSADGTARIWDVRTGKPLLVWKDSEGGLCDARFSPDGTKVVTASGPVRVWDARSGKLLATLKWKDHPALAVFFHPEGERIFAHANDEALRCWPLDLLSVGRQRKPRELTPAERERYELNGFRTWD
jgi:WD40 repeat protein